ncbi:MAG: response regulator transcription factor [Chitinophagaceae bacterium]|nr:response regulator transcription factor [Chitinophagaceae bacterium]
MEGYNILLVEDDVHLGFLLKQNFELKGYQVTVCEKGSEAYEQLKVQTFDLYILDVMLPEENGFDVARKIQEYDKNKPFLFLTAVNTEPEKFEGYELGAEDYIFKPFSFRELEYKIQVILRRTTNSISDITLFGDVTFDKRLRTLQVLDTSFKLTRRECDLLSEFLKRKNAVVNRRQVLLKLWEREDKYTLRSMDVHLAKLRKILLKSNQVKLENIYGEGHRLLVIEAE